MAGVVPTKRASSGRKQWTLHDGPKSSLKRLRNQLANDGCAESQVVLAKQLLDEQCDIDGDQRENDRLGVYWLIKSSEQGNEEATNLLKKCYSNGRGITEHNYIDVKSCINMTQDEKLARKAAREMFASLSNGEDYITSQQLQKRMLEIDKAGHSSVSENSIHGASPDASSSYSNGELIHNYDRDDSSSGCCSSEDEDSDWSNRSDCVNEKLTEDNMIAAAVDYSHGYLPLVNNVLFLSVPNLSALDHINYVHRSILHPILVLKIVYFKLIKMLGSKLFFDRLSSHNSEFYIVSLLFVYCFFGSINLVDLVPNLIYYGTYLVMIVMTFHMLQAKRNYSDFRVWSNLFLTYSGGNLNANEVEYQFIRNNLKPYAYFFVSLLLHLLVYPLVSDEWIPRSELTIMAFCLTFMTLHGFMVVRDEINRFPDLLLLFSFAINVLAKYPYETDPVVTQGWRFLDLNIPTFASHVIGNGIEFCLNFKIVFYLLIPVLFGRIASRQKWRGTYRYLIPHCVTLSWLQVVIINSQSATMYGLLRGTLALVGIVMFVPLVGLTTVILPAIALTKWLATSISWYSMLIFIVFATIGLMSSWLLTKTHFSRYIAFLQVTLGVITFFVLIDSELLGIFTNERLKNDNFIRQDVRSFSWEQFHTFCQEPAWETHGIAATQIRCAKLHGLKVEWEGFVNEVKIKTVNNLRRKFVETFPKFSHHYLSCLMGEPVAKDCDGFTETISRDDCLLFHDLVGSQNECSLDKYDFYTFEIVIRKDVGLWSKLILISLDASDEFRNFTLKLRPNDVVRFVGLLNSFEDGTDSSNYRYNIGNLAPRLTLQEIECLACKDTELTKYETKSQRMIDLNALFKNLYVSCKFVFNLLFYPIVIFK